MTTKFVPVLKSLTAAAAVAAIFPIGAQAATGTVKFQGEIVQSTCDVTTATKDQTVVIGTYPTSLFANVGDVSSSKAFQIGLQNCDAGTYTIRFDGNAPAGHPELLAVSQATGVGIEILDNNGKVFPIGQDVTDPALVEVAADGTATVDLKARYKSFASTVGAGEANADSTFSIEYR